MDVITATSTVLTCVTAVPDWTTWAVVPEGRRGVDPECAPMRLWFAGPDGPVLAEMMGRVMMKGLVGFM